MLPLILHDNQIKNTERTDNSPMMECSVGHTLNRHIYIIQHNKFQKIITINASESTSKSHHLSMVSRDSLEKDMNKWQECMTIIICQIMSCKSCCVLCMKFKYPVDICYCLIIDNTSDCSFMDATFFLTCTQIYYIVHRTLKKKRRKIKNYNNGIEYCCSRKQHGRVFFEFWLTGPEQYLPVYWRLKDSRKNIKYSKWLGHKSGFIRKKQMRLD